MDSFELALLGFSSLMITVVWSTTFLCLDTEVKYVFGPTIDEFVWGMASFQIWFVPNIIISFCFIYPSMR